nr:MULTISPECIES: FCD domain-containing protein [unclassified Halomonas]
MLQRAGKRGYRVREFTETDVLCALEVRGVLEGLAARRLAEQGMTEETDTRLAQCIEDGRELLTKGYLDRDDVTRWSEINEVFHTTIIESTGSLVIADAIGRNNHLPFASADSIILDTEALDREYRKLYFAQMQHRTVFQALRLGEGARAEMLMREHAYIGMRYGELLDLDPAGTLPS